ncbi:hypothetical protein [Pseudoprevotella muciniphila]|uniref:hypothetical protein n=1 Tax=Pseudoprevotella muciniphila TaxID=2133944 RepID=UPI0018676CF1|nr:hypothetical protein [Pseudoprevotella muciniphila]
MIIQLSEVIATLRVIGVAAFFEVIEVIEVIATLEVNDVTNADVFFFFFGILLV